MWCFKSWKCSTIFSFAKFIYSLCWMLWLGNTLAQIAGEKAGIFKVSFWTIPIRLLLVHLLLNFDPIRVSILFFYFFMIKFSFSNTGWNSSLHCASTWWSNECSWREGFWVKCKLHIVHELGNSFFHLLENACVGCWLQIIGCWLQIIGYWVLMWKSTRCSTHPKSSVMWSRCMLYKMILVLRCGSRTF
jgi:hypothetical protein